MKLTLLLISILFLSSCTGEVVRNDIPIKLLPREEVITSCPPLLFLRLDTTTGKTYCSSEHDICQGGTLTGGVTEPESCI